MIVPNISGHCAPVIEPTDNAKPKTTQFVVINGKKIPKALYKPGKNFLIINSTNYNNYVTNAQIGDSTNSYFLNSLGISNFDVCIVAIGSNFQNSLETTSLLKELGAKKVISRAERDVQAKFLLRNGADDVVYPEKQMARWTAIRYTADHVLDYVEVDKDNALFEVEVPPKWIGKTIRELDVRNSFNINIIRFYWIRKRVIKQTSRH